MDIEKLIDRLGENTDCWTDKVHGYADLRLDAATTLSTLQAENDKLRAELGREQRLYESEKEDFIDCVCSGVPNLSPYCMNRHPDCVDERGWCRTEKCRGFSRDRDRKED